MHARRAIVNAAAAACGHLQTTGSRVYPGRSLPIPDEEAAHLLIYARQEQSGSATMKGAARGVNREARLVVEGIDTGATDDDAILDTIAEEVETAIAADPTLGGTCKNLVIVQTEIDVNNEGEHRVATIRLTFSVFYMTAANAPSTAV